MRSSGRWGLPTKIAIIGLGLIGASMGMALKRSKGIAGLKITGHDREPGSARVASKKGAVDSTERSLPATVHNADLVIIATPVMAAKEVMEIIAPHLQEGCIVTDTASTKADVLKWAEELLPEHVSFVGGHPLAGKESSGPEAAEANLFQDARYCVIPGARAKKGSVQTVVNLAELVGAKPFFLDAHEHDSFVAGVSHLPIVLSSALVASATKSPSWHEISRLAASGFRDVTRLAAGDPEMNRDICITNAGEIAPWVDRLIVELLEIRRHLQEGDGEALTQHFLSTHLEREKWMAGVPLGPQTGPTVELPNVGDRMTSMLFGDLMAGKAKDMMKQYEQPEEGKGKKV